MANTYTLISSVTVGAGGVSSISFSSIPGIYTDLCLKFSLRGNRASVYDQIYLDINGGGTAATARYVMGNGSSASSGTTGAQIALGTGSTATANTFGNGEVYFPNYAGSSYKSYSAEGVNENNGTEAHASLFGSSWSNTSAITSLLIYNNGGTISQYSTAYLYGIKNS